MKRPANERGQDGESGQGADPARTTTTRAATSPGLWATHRRPPAVPALPKWPAAAAAAAFAAFAAFAAEGPAAGAFAPVARPARRHRPPVSLPAPQHHPRRAPIPRAPAPRPPGPFAPLVTELASPDDRIVLVAHATDVLAYDVFVDGKPVVRDARLSMDIGDVRLGREPVVSRVTRASVNRVIEPVVAQQAAHLNEAYNQMTLDCAGGFSVEFRAYDQGVAYRFVTALPGAEQQVLVYGEQAAFNFAADADVFYPREDSFFSHNERVFGRVRLSSIAARDLASLPAVVTFPDGTDVAIVESDLDEYPGLWLRGTGGPGLTATFPAYPRKEKLVKDRDLTVVEREPFIARTRGTRTYPWRGLAIAHGDRELPENALVYLLQRPSEIGDATWIRPGKVAWDWWNARGLRDVPFVPGPNTETYKAFVDFAAESGIEYVILDEGWYQPGDLLATAPGLDMDALMAHARAKHVGIILWAIWKTLDDQLQPALDRFQKWGVAGVKVDFMQRDDQPVIDFYHRVSRELARRHMLVDYHGAIRAALMTRTFPNIISNEGVQGLEHVKWSRATEPEHDLTLPFTRMLLGPMDYTPGAMHNATREAFRIDFNNPMSLGTRCHQLAMYVVFESPLQMLADSPSNYREQPDALRFIAGVPTVWDESRVLDGRIGDYVVMARRSGRDWYLGAMSDWTARALSVDLDFLRDGPDGRRAASAGAGAASQLPGHYRDPCRCRCPFRAAYSATPPSR